MKSSRVFSPDAAVSARAARGWQTIHEHYVMISRAGGGLGVVWVCMVMAVRWRRVVIGTVVLFFAVQAAWGRQRVVMWVAVRVRGEVW